MPSRRAGSARTAGNQLEADNAQHPGPSDVARSTSRCAAPSETSSAASQGPLCDLVATAFSVATTLVLSAVPVVASAATTAAAAPVVPPVATIAAVAASIAVTLTYTLAGISISSSSGDCSGESTAHAHPDVAERGKQSSRNFSKSSCAPAQRRQEVKAGGYLIGAAQLPPGATAESASALVAQARKSWQGVGQPAPQRVLRLLLGCDLDPTAALAKASEVEDWRQAHGLSRTRDQLRRELSVSGQVTLPFHNEISRLVTANPCAAVSLDGNPITIWHVGTANTSTSAVEIPNEHLEGWSRAVFEYVDLWIGERTEKTGRLAGHIQIFNLHGLSFWHVASVTLAEKFKKVLGPAGYYVESTSHIYAVNASPIFSMAWKAVQGLVGPRTASKITVSAEALPEDLLAELSSASAERLSKLLAEPRADVPVLNPGSRA